MRKIFFYIFLFQLSFLQAFAERAENYSERVEKYLEDDSLNIRKGIKLGVLPIVYYLPETSFAIGGAGIGMFRFSKEQKRASVVQFAGYYTLKNQVNLTSTFDFFAKGEDLRFIGELSYYNYYYNFYGLSKRSLREDFERYQAIYPRFRLSSYKKLKELFSVGLLYQFEGIKSINYEANGLIDNNDLTGKDGGVISNLGVGFLYDSRDNIISPYKGLFVEFQYVRSDNLFLSAFNYDDFRFDTRYFTTLKGGITIASNLLLGHMIGDVPFYDMYTIGSSRRARGITDRRFTDKATIVGQVELRFPLWWRFRANIFASSASVSNSLSTVFQNKYTQSYGLGLRYVLNKNDRALLRFDVGRSVEGFNFYFTAGEAF